MNNFWHHYTTVIPKLLNGVSVTLEITFFAVLIGIVIGMFMAHCQHPCRRAGDGAGQDEQAPVAQDPSEHLYRMSAGDAAFRPDIFVPLRRVGSR